MVLGDGNTSQIFMKLLTPTATEIFIAHMYLLFTKHITNYTFHLSILLFSGFLFSFLSFLDASTCLLFPGIFKKCMFLLFL